MLSFLKRLPPVQSILAIAFLLVQAGCVLYLPYLTAGLVDGGIMAGDLSFIRKQGGLMLGISALSLMGALLNMYLAGRIAFRFGKALRDDIFTTALSFSMAEYDRFGTSALITRNTNDVTQVQTVVEMAFKFLILAPIYLIGGIYLTWKLSPALALPFAAVIPFMALAAVVIYRFAVPLYTKMQSLLERLNRLFREGITGVRVIRAFVKEEEDYKKYEATNRDYTRTSITAGTIMSVFVPLITLIISLAALVIVWIGGNSAAGGRMEVGAIMAAVSYSMQILMGFGLLTNVILTLPRGQVSAKRIREVLDMPLSIRNVPVPEAAAGVSLSFYKVSFHYPGVEKAALSDISFTVKQGQTLAVAGGTGDGKSSLLALIPRFYDAERGSVYIGGKDVRVLAQEEVRGRVSYAPQKSSLLTGTIRSNLLLAKPDAGDGELWSALEDASAAEFVRKLPEGLDSPVEKGGANFSGGQRQRLCIARCILKEADIYLFDDSFSALDFKTDAAVRAALRRRLADKITVIVAQRLGTIASADLIAVLDRGSLTGLGTHEELRENNPVYREIIRSQNYQEAAA